MLSQETTNEILTAPPDEVLFMLLDAKEYINSRADAAEIYGLFNEAGLTWDTSKICPLKRPK